MEIGVMANGVGSERTVSWKGRATGRFTLVDGNTIRDM